MYSSNQTTPAASNYRWVICALLFWVTTANYIDRGVFGNLAPEMPKYLQLADKVQPAEMEQYWNEQPRKLARPTPNTSTPRVMSKPARNA